jgi:hypothetical protein
MLARYLFFLTVICSLIFSIVSDIPSHCLSSQIMGDWIFYHTNAVPKTLSELYNHKCGIKDHTDKLHIKDVNMDLNTFTYSFEVKFNKNHTSEIINNSNGFNIDKVNIKK